MPDTSAAPLAGAMMSRDLQVTFRGGRLLAAYLSFRNGSKATASRTRREADGILVDYDDAGTPIGIEFIAPSKVSLAKINSLLGSLGQDSASADELWPLISNH
ncbi:MAG TPA: DUF2283 domain-containing protein [Tepidisphaeraceae bacterium]